MKKLLSALLCIAAVALPAPATAREPLQPAAKWVVNFHESQCVASREYGNPAKPTTLGVKAPPLAKVMQIVVLRPGTRGTGIQSRATISFDRLKAAETTLVSYDVPGNQRMHMVNLPNYIFEQARAAQVFSITTDGEFREEFRLAGIGPLLQTMATCVQDLESHWNVALIEASESNGSPVSGSIAGLFSFEDYPVAAINGEQQGSVGVILLVDQKGAVSDCTLVETSGSAVLDAQACAVIKKRAKFKAAVDASGRPRRGAIRQRITWRLAG